MLKPIEQAFQELQDDHEGFDRLSRFLHDATGIYLPRNSKNLTLMATRLGPMLKKQGIPDYATYLAGLQKGDSVARAGFVSALTTNTTQFFREAQHFDVLKKEISGIASAKAAKYQREIRIWCAAASSGQEPYTIAIVLLESLPDPASWNIKILATDIDQKILQKAAGGFYSTAEIESVPPLYRQKYFEATAGSKERGFQVRDEVRRLIRFAPLNLNEPKYPFQFPFDVVFCRNVLIYFEPEASLRVVHQMAETLAPEGLLFLGHSESGAMRTPLLKQIAPAAYRKK